MFIPDADSSGAAGSKWIPVVELSEDGDGAFPAHPNQVVVTPGGCETIICGAGLPLMRNGAVAGRQAVTANRFASNLRDASRHVRRSQRAGTVKEVILKNSITHIANIKNGTGRPVKELFAPERVKLLCDSCNGAGVFRGKTVIVAGSGPSLNRNGALLFGKEHRTLPVVAINAALPFFGKRADYFFICDWMAKKEWWAGMDMAGCNLVTSVTTPQEVLDAKWKGVYYYAGLTQGDFNEEYAERLGPLDGNLLATYSALHFVFACGAKKILLVGQDFACTGGLYHWNEPFTFLQYRDMLGRPVQDCNGHVTFTTELMNTHAHLILGLCRVNEPDVEIRNCSEAGILQWNNQPLKEALEDEYKTSGECVEVQNCRREGEEEHYNERLGSGVHSCRNQPKERPGLTPAPF